MRRSMLADAMIGALLMCAAEPLLPSEAALPHACEEWKRANKAMQDLIDAVNDTGVTE